MHISIKAAVCFLSIFASGLLSAGIPKYIQQPPLVASESSETQKNMARVYYTFNYPSGTAGGDTLLTGIRGVKQSPKKVYISGFYKYPGGTPVVPFVYKGGLLGPGRWYVLKYPSAPGRTVSATYLYGPNNGHGRSNIQVVGNYTTDETDSSTLGCLYEGRLEGSGKWTTLIPTSSDPVLNTIAHSTMGGLVVGNYETSASLGKAFIYDIKHKKYYNIIKRGAASITAYGIWHNGGDSYTICGGYTNVPLILGITAPKNAIRLESAYLVDWNKKSRKFRKWRSYHYNNDPITAAATHFDGISADGSGGYNLTGDWYRVGSGSASGFFCAVRGKSAKWSPIAVPAQTATSGNSVYSTVVIGVYTAQDNTVNGYLSFP